MKILRQLAFAAGLGLLAYGTGHLFSEHHYYANNGGTQWGWNDLVGPQYMGYGGVLVGLAIPLVGVGQKRDIL